MPQESVEFLIPFLTPSLKLSVKIEFGPQDTYAFTADYIGCKLNRYLVVEFPKKVQEALVMRQVANAQVVIRGITQSKLGHIIAFKSSILGTVTMPAGLMFLRMPKHFASKPIRSHERYPVDEPITVLANTVTYEAVMQDFSVNGCAFFLKGENPFEKNTQISIESEFSRYWPSGITFTIVSIEKQTLGHRYGVKFDQTLEMSADLKHELLERSFVATPV